MDSKIPFLDGYIGCIRGVKIGNILMNLSRLLDKDGMFVSFLGLSLLENLLQVLVKEKELNHFVLKVTKY